MRTKRRGGFTLVEMLVVVAIIGILAAILVPAVFFALARGEGAVIGMEVARLSGAIEEYKTILHKEYPPNFDNAAVVTAHVQAKFGKYNPTIGTPPPVGLDAAEALVFWLRGYGPSPTDPLDATPGVRKPVFQFDESRLVDLDMDGNQEYVPRGGGNVPYVYFRNDSYAMASYAGAGTGTCKPYTTGAGVFANANSFQIITAGQDEDWGANSADKRYPSGLNYNDGDRDNYGNFSEGTSLGDAVP